MGFLYLWGGIASLIFILLSGKLIARIGTLPVVWIATGWLFILFYFGYIQSPPRLPLSVVFAGFMAGMSTRNVAVMSLSSHVPRPNERARFMSFQSAVQHLSSALGAFCSSLILASQSDGSLIGVPTLAWVAGSLFFIIPFLVSRLERSLSARTPITDTVLHPT